MAKRTDFKYRTYGFFGKVPLININSQWKNYFDNKFNNIDVSIDTEELENNIKQTVIDYTVQSRDDIKEHVTNTTDKAKNEIIEKIDNIDINVDVNMDEQFNKLHNHIDEAKDDLTCKICCAKNEIEKHVSKTAKNLHLDEKFSDLNEQVTEILKKL